LNGAHDLDPTDVGVLQNRGEVKRWLKDYNGALQDLDRALELIPDDPISLQFRGAAKRCAGNYHGALQDLLQAQKFEPEDEFTREEIELAREQLGMSEPPASGQSEQSSSRHNSPLHTPDHSPQKELTKKRVMEPEPQERSHEMSIQQVSEWSRELGLSMDYAQVFEEHGVDGEALTLLIEDPNPEDWKVLIPRIGDRKKIENKWKLLRQKITAQSLKKRTPRINLESS
jgi:tetratricopeptide (TPR) repeat protein